MAMDKIILPDVRLKAGHQVKYEKNAGVDVKGVAFEVKGPLAPF